jgi:hypothetical protein
VGAHERLHVKLPMEASGAASVRTGAASMFCASRPGRESILGAVSRASDGTVAASSESSNGAAASDVAASSLATENEGPHPVRQDPTKDRARAKVAGPRKRFMTNRTIAARTALC